MLKRTLLITLLVFTAFLNQNETTALSCGEPDIDNRLSPKEHIEASRLVFEGKVGGYVSTEENRRTKDIDIIRWYKGKVDKDVQLTWSQWALEPKEGEKIIFVFNNEGSDDEYLRFGAEDCPIVNPATIPSSSSSYAEYTRILSSEEYSSSSDRIIKVLTYALPTSFIGALILTGAFKHYKGKSKV